MRHIVLLVCLGLLASASAPSTAQVRTLQGVRAIAPAPQVVNVVDRQALVERRLVALGKKNRALEGRIATLESALREMRAASEFTCTTAQRSTNGRGNEECAPFACNYLDGRCRTTAASTDHCAAGFVWNGSGQCVAPPPPAEDDECFLFFC
jgi:hypothetical protein